MALALAIDLGSTQFKAAVLQDPGQLAAVRSLPTPPLRGEDPIRESDPIAALAIVDELLGAFSPDRSALPLGIASQRSSFLLWDRSDGSPRTPLISWQDRRAQRWCETRADLEPLCAQRTGLRLSPHYAGPKLATLFDDHPQLRREADRGHLLFGTLETWLTWRWSHGECHQTDLSMAARTLMVDLATANWSDELLAAFGIPAGILPSIASTAGRRGPAAATAADQACGALATLDPGGADLLINLGTGCFVMQGAGAGFRTVPGYLFAPLCGGRPETRYVLEGTVNGGGTVADRYGSGPTHLPAQDTAPAIFCLPDSAGIGAPHWRSDLGFTLSPGAERADREVLRRVVLEGLVFRAIGIAEDLTRGCRRGDVFISGGLTREPFVGEALACCFGHAVKKLAEQETTLLGAAHLAAGLPLPAQIATETIEPSDRGAYLIEKRSGWQRWVEQLVGR